MFLKLQVGNIFLKPEFVFNSNEVAYELDEIIDGNTISTLFTEQYQYLDFPIMLGYQMGFFHLNAGPVGHYFISSKSELYDIDGYDQKFDQFKWALQLGGGIDIAFVHLDIRYEGNLSRFGDHISFWGDSYEFDDNASRWIGTVSVSF